MSLQGKTILVIIAGGVAAYKVPDLIRRLRERGANVRAVLTEAASRFIQPTLVAAVSGAPAMQDLFEPVAGMDIGHIRLAREADLIVVAPATADIMAKIASGLADDLATAILLARDSPLLVAPAMNPHMWSNPATVRNVARLTQDGVVFVGPEAGEMAEPGEAGLGRMAEPAAILAAIERHLVSDERLKGLSFLVTSGPTEEPLDPVRFISNRSSGKQGHAIAAALARAGARVTLVSGPVAIPDPLSIDTVHVQTADEMLAAVERCLPVDGAIFAAAVADWRPATVSNRKLKKDPTATDESLTIALARNPDILATIGHHRMRPHLVVGFAAETDDLLANAQSKLGYKGADWILANDVSPGTNVLGGDENQVTVVTRDGAEAWPHASKAQIAARLVDRVAAYLKRS